MAQKLNESGLSREKIFMILDEEVALPSRQIFFTTQRR
jgi:hypothetical protein